MVKSSERTPATQRAYGTDRAAFMRWCVARGRTSLPATEETLATYAVHLTSAPRERTGRPASVASVERAMSAISTLHAEHGLPRPVMSGARQVINGYATRLRRIGHSPTSTPTATPEAVQSMLATLAPTLAGRRDAALILLGVTTGAGPAELTAIDITDFSLLDHGLDTTLYRTKVRLWSRDTLDYHQDPAACPARATRSYMAALAAKGRTHGPLFLRIDRHDYPAAPLMRSGQMIGDPTGRLTPQAAAQVVTRAARRAGLPGRWSGRSLRA